MRLSLAAIEQAQAAIRAGGNHNAESVHGSPGVRRVVMRVCVAMGLAAGAQSRERRDGNGQPPVCRWSGGAREILVSAGPLFVQCAREETRIAGGRFILITQVWSQKKSLPYRTQNRYRID